ncbi:hypothetical protein, partial [Fischerella muscicola]|uniref:hypothetical protein n=1 Tax=Fischerella muscicola TaxID=92938 RepID=UPI001CA5B201
RQSLFVGNQQDRAGSPTPHTPDASNSTSLHYSHSSPPLYLPSAFTNTLKISGLKYLTQP